MSIDDARPQQRPRRKTPGKAPGKGRGKAPATPRPPSATAGTAPAGTLTPYGTAGTALSGVRVHDLRAAYADQLVHPMTHDGIAVLQQLDEVEARAAALRATLAAHGVDDIAEQGVLVFAGTVTAGPGFRTGVGTRPVVRADGTLSDASVSDYLGPLARRTATASPPPVVRGTRARRHRPGRVEEVAPAASTAAGSTARASATATSTPVGTSQPVTHPGATMTRALLTAPSTVIRQDQLLIAVDELELADGTQLLLERQVRHLTILARHLKVGTDCSIAWEPQPPTAAARGADGDDGVGYPRSTVSSGSSLYASNGEHGADGQIGETGAPGDDGPTIEIWALEADRVPDLLVGGDDGGAGGRGGDGGDGGDGAKGSDSVAKFLECEKNPGFGGDGGDGGNAGRGGTGGRGGHGGDVMLFLTDDTHDAVLARGFSIDQSGGDGGDGGPGGLRGAGGRGGEAGDPTGLACKARPERVGTNGEVGLVGKPGPRGAEGDLGHLTAAVVTEAQFRDKWLAPRIATITPTRVSVGDRVTLNGAGYTSDMTVRFDGLVGSTTFLWETRMEAVVPPIATGWAEVTVSAPGGMASNPGAVEVVPSVAAVTPSPTRLGQQVTLTGSGFGPSSRVIFRGVALTPDQIATDGSFVRVTLPAPSGPFEDVGGTEELVVRDDTGATSGTVTVVLRHVVDSGFRGPVNAWGFINSPTQSVANHGTFSETYGTGEVALAWVVDPILTGAWFAFYLAFFAGQPGYSSGFAATAAYEYWSGNPDLYTDFTSLPQVERRMTVAQGHVLSEELLGDLAVQAAGGRDRINRTVDEVLVRFRAAIGASPDEQLREAPVSQIMPTGTILSPGFIDRLSISHGVLPIRVEFPEDGETWTRRMVVYDNATSTGNSGDESYVVVTDGRNGPSWVLEHYDAVGVLDSVDADFSSEDGYTLSCVSLQRLLLDDVDLPHSFLMVLSPATLVVEDAEGRRFGVAGDERWAEIPGAYAGIGVKGLYVLPMDQDLDVTVHGTGEGTYTLAAVDGTTGRGVTLQDVPVRRGTVDHLRLRERLTDVHVTSEDPAKQVDVLLGTTDGTELRTARLPGLRVGGGQEVGVRTTAGLAEVTLDGASAPVAVHLRRVRGRQVDEHDLAVAPGTPSTVPPWTRGPARTSDDDAG